MLSYEEYKKIKAFVHMNLYMLIFLNVLTFIKNGKINKKIVPDARK